MFELNKAYGWSKFIVIVPSVAIREGVFKTFQITREHFAGEYNKKILFFIYALFNQTVDNLSQVLILIRLNPNGISNYGNLN